MSAKLVAVDIGNSETEMIFDGVLCRQPSVVKSIPKKPNIPEEKVSRRIANLLDEMIVHISSNAVKKQGLYFVGERAASSGQNLMNMNILLGNKHKNDIPVIMTLSMIAAREIQSYYQENKKLPEDNFLRTEIDFSTMIPASEYNKERASFLQDRFKGNTHTVIVNVGETLVTVSIKFNRVKVTQEGIPAHYALIQGKEDILDTFKETYSEDLTQKNVNPMDFKDKKILMVNIGDGSTEYIYIKNMNPVSDACSGEQKGIGHATEQAIQILKEQMDSGFSINRQQFMKIYRNPDHNLHEVVKPTLTDAKMIQAEEIIESISEKVLTELSGECQYILVYGGGSIELKDVMFEDLLDFSNNNFVKLLWIPEQYAVDLDVTGLDILNEKVFFKQPSSKA